MNTIIKIAFPAAAAALAGSAGFAGYQMMNAFMSCRIWPIVSME